MAPAPRSCAILRYRDLVPAYLTRFIRMTFYTDVANDVRSAATAVRCYRHDVVTFPRCHDLFCRLRRTTALLHTI